MLTGWAAHVRRLLAVGCAVTLTATGCAFSGLNSLPLPGAVGRGSGAGIYHVEIANVTTLESNSPVMLNDVVVGSVGKMTVKNWRADVELSVRPGAVVPANAVATVGQTSVLGSLHLSLDPPLGQPPSGRLTPGATIPLSASSTYPSTEQTLSSLSVVLNAGQLGQIGDVIHNVNAALSGREGQLRDLFTRLDTFAGTFDDQRGNIVATIQALDRFSGGLAARDDVIAEALDKIPPALDVLDRERPRITTALEKLGTFSDTATRLVHDAGGDLVKDLHNLDPTLRALADVGPDLDAVLGSLLFRPLTQSQIDRAVRGDYINGYLVVDLTVPRLKRDFALGTRFGQEGAPMVPAPGDPFYRRYTYDPLGAGVAPPPHNVAPPPDALRNQPPTPPPSAPDTPVLGGH
jgi:phospholipid/cholesterol/gamma-HCH transport system substrate-binding protein